MKLTIAMATHDDYDGTFFACQSLRLHHPACADAEFLIMDSNPDSAHGKEVAKFCKTAGLCYVPMPEQSSWNKYRAFDLATGDVVIVLDCHVLLHPGAVDAVLEYFRLNPGADMLQGPCVYDCLKHYGTHFDPAWRGHDFGTWGTSYEAMKAGAPFSIPMCGMGCFALRRAAWKGINQGFTGFGSEEWYMAEKVRSWGGDVKCHPAFKWTHRWGRPGGVPYKFSFEDKIYNYAVGWHELYGLDDPRFMGMMQHFSTQIDPKKVCQIVTAAILDSLPLSCRKSIPTF